MNNYFIFTDATSDLPKQFYEDNFKVIKMPYNINGVEYYCDDPSVYADFFRKVREGAVPTTSMINPETFKNEFKPVLSKGMDLIYICFSSALSGTCQSANIARSELEKEYPERKIFVVDSKCASLGEGLLVYYALKKRAEGASITELNTYIEDLKNHLHHDFTVEDLFHLFRGGRVSRSTAIVGSALQIKPLLVTDTEGRLTPIGKVMGRRQSLRALVEKMEEKSKGYKNDIIFVGHCDCLEDAQFVAEKVTKRFGITNIVIDYIGPIVGSHSGPGTVALFYLASDKEK